MNKLRVAFFGSDRFSIASLQSLLRLQQHKPAIVLSVDVVTRKIKPKGRKLISYDDLPVGVFATENNINVLRADSKSEILDILSQKPFDIAIAVSYGNLIPREFIESMKYGGLNVHPSLLPKYAGSSPMQYALMNDDTHTGVTVQTLHPTKFDRGDVLLQSDPVPIEDADNYASLESKLGLLGGSLLTDVLEKGLYVSKPSFQPSTTFSLASKISTSTANIDWGSTSRQIKRLNDALGTLYTYIYCNPLKKSKTGTFKRVLLLGIQQGPASDSEPGTFFLDEPSNSMIVATGDGSIIIKDLTFECCTLEDAKTFHKRLNKRTGKADHIFKSHIN